ncbi:LOW QUALITY PROTEIN: uncharacterized protein LOC117332279 [Pecten maximus]|uniref:LOW QUALITY PROTEIN: uncharacterized protein LOC117332279 n=1 Tax=Pecten maximus TaxID=6579 RepID=UPI0014586F02|nr:LOW QUALITY PROTEIN: uncharacterized protein LOC117332279 [Pecten maximus]
MEDTVWIRPVKGQNTINVLEKLRSISHWLDGRPDTTAFDYIYRVNMGAGLNLFQGDIDGFNPNRRTATTNKQNLWNTRLVPYIIDPLFETSEERDIHAAIEEYHQKTCIRFVPRTNEEDYIRLTKIDGCYSKIGRVGGGQNVSLVSACLKKGTVIHELMHVLGFFHEQTRPDRDAWVQVITENIRGGYEHNFDKLDSRLVDNLGVEYDYGSVLHYSKYAFSTNGNPTILPTRMTLATLGQRYGFSYLDLERINLLYRCDIPGPLPVSYTSTSTSTSTTPTTTIHPTPAITPTYPQHSTYHIPSPYYHGPSNTASQNRHAFHIISRTDCLPTTTINVSPAPTQSTAFTTPETITSTGWSHWSVWSFCNLQCLRTRYRFCFSNHRSNCPGMTEEKRRCTTGCRVAWTLGCWHNNLTNSAIPSVEGQYPTLTDQYHSREGSVRKCANVASDSGHVVFAVFNSGMCLSGPDAQKTFYKYGPSTLCSYTGEGSTTAMNVYTFQQDIDGAWGPWTDWTQCTQMCNGGKKYRYRYCNSPPPVGHGATCLGSGHEVQDCNIQPCPADTKCGVKYHTGLPGTSGIINVGEYDNFMKCEYEIVTAETDLTISVSITRIDLEYTVSCMSDALLIFDGPNDNATFLGAHCGTVPPASVLSSSNKMYLKFLTDETTTGTGFTVLYTINQNIRKSCIQPRRPGHGRLIGDSHFAGDSIFFECDHRYNLIGSSSVVCVDQPTFAVWSDDFPSCVQTIARKAREKRHTLCSFEGNLCGFKQQHNDTDDWVLAKGDVGRFPQRPMGDHSHGLMGKGHFLVAETTRLNRPGDTATVESKTVSPITWNQCLTFWVRVIGRDNSYLDVVIRSPSRSENLFTVPVDTGYREGMVWLEYSATFQSKEPYQIEFGYTVGEGFGSSVALDDVSIQPGSCML